MGNVSDVIFSGATASEGYSMHPVTYKSALNFDSSSSAEDNFADFLFTSIKEYYFYTYRLLNVKTKINGRDGANFGVTLRFTKKTLTAFSQKDADFIRKSIINIACKKHGLLNEDGTNKYSFTKRTKFSPPSEPLENARIELLQVFNDYFSDDKFIGGNEHANVIILTEKEPKTKIPPKPRPSPPITISNQSNSYSYQDEENQKIIGQLRKKKNLLKKENKLLKLAFGLMMMALIASLAFNFWPKNAASTEVSRNNQQQTIEAGNTAQANIKKTKFPKKFDKAVASRLMKHDIKITGKRTDNWRVVKELLKITELYYSEIPWTAKSRERFSKEIVKLNPTDVKACLDNLKDDSADVASGVKALLKQLSTGKTFDLPETQK